MNDRQRSGTPPAPKGKEINSANLIKNIGSTPVFGTISKLNLIQRLTETAFRRIKRSLEYRYARQRSLRSIGINGPPQQPALDNPIRREPVINYNEYPFRQADPIYRAGSNEILIARLRSSNLHKLRERLVRVLRAYQVYVFFGIDTRAAA